MYRFFLLPLFMMLLSSTPAQSQSAGLRYDKEVIAISKALAEGKDVSKWKQKSYYKTLAYFQKAYGSFWFQDSLVDLSLLRRPDPNSMVVAYLVYSISMASSPQLDKDSLCKAKLKTMTEQVALLRYYESLLYSFFPTGVPDGRDLSGLNIELDKLGLKDDTEKMIVFVTAANRLTPGIELNARNPEASEKNIRYVMRAPKFSGLDFMELPLLPFNDFMAGGLAFKEQVARFNYVKDIYNQVYEVER